MFQLKETYVSAIVNLSLHLRKHMKTLQKCVSADVFPNIATECVMETAETQQFQALLHIENNGR